MDPQSSITSEAQLLEQAFHGLVNLNDLPHSQAALVPRERVIAKMESPERDPCEMFVHRMKFDGQISTQVPSPAYDLAVQLIEHQFLQRFHESELEAGDGEGAAAIVDFDAPMVEEEEGGEEEIVDVMVAGEAMPFSSVKEEDKEKMTDAEYTQYFELCLEST
jgi:hypothetical protein